MILLNFSHPLSPNHLQQIEALTGQQVERVVEVHSRVDSQQPLVPQVVLIADKVGLSPNEWQTQPILVNPPSLNFIAVALLAELHGRMGYFPAHLRLRPVQGKNPSQFEVAEILNLHSLRDRARKRRG